MAFPDTWTTLSGSGPGREAPARASPVRVLLFARDTTRIREADEPEIHRSAVSVRPGD